MIGPGLGARGDGPVAHTATESLLGHLPPSAAPLPPQIQPPGRGRQNRGHWAGRRDIGVIQALSQNLNGHHRDDTRIQIDNASTSADQKAMISNVKCLLPKRLTRPRLACGLDFLFFSGRRLAQVIELQQQHVLHQATFDRGEFGRNHRPMSPVGNDHHQHLPQEGG